MTLEELKALLAQIKADPAAATDEQLTAAMDAIRAQVEDAKKATPTTDVIASLRELKDVRTAVVAEQAGRTQAAAQVASEAAGLLSELDADPDPVEPVAPETPAEPPAGSPPPAPMVPPLTPAQMPTDTPPAAPATDTSSDLQTVAASLSALAAALTQNFAAGQPPAPSPAEPPAAKPTGRAAGRIGQTPPAGGPARDSVTMTVHAAGSDGSRQHGQVIGSSAELGRIVADRLRGANTSGGNGRQYVASVKMDYPESRQLLGDNGDTSDNLTKIERVTSVNALVAAGGLCAPLETLYDVEVIGSTARPVRDALARFAVDRGGIQYRQNMSAAAAVYGANVWTVAQDAANPVGSKGCYVVDCPGIVNAVIQAVYLCLEFSNISTRFDPEITAANVQKGVIAHHRVAENALLSSLSAGSKILSAPQVIGATRDILVNLDKATAYYRNRHRLTDTMPLTMIMPGWVKSMMRADIARQIAAGDWISALGIADSQIDNWFGTRSVSPVWHLDGPTGADELQTVTVTGAPTGGTFTLTYAGQTTAPIAYNATAATVQSALGSLSNTTPYDITVTGAAGGPYSVLFDQGLSGGQFHGADVAQMTASGASLTGGTTPSVTVTTTTAGAGALTVNGISISSQTYANAAAGSVLPGFPDQIDSLLFPTGSWLFLDGGSLDLGLVRDSTLNDRNRYRQFMETFEAAAYRGIESMRLVMTVEPTGSTSGTTNINAIND